MKKPLRKQKEIVIPFCEGEAEIKLFGFLKLNHSNKIIGFGKPINIGGFSDFEIFKRKYKKLSRAQNLKPRKDFLSIRFLFIIDNDLADSTKIVNYLKTEKHLVQLCEPNTEGMILEIIGKKQTCTTGKDIFRKKCKDAFKDHFGCEVHKLNESSLNQIFADENKIKDKLPILHKLFKS